VRDNRDPHRAEDSDPDELVVRPADRRFLADGPFLPLMAAAQPAEAAFDLVLANAGATRPGRDALDRRAVEDVMRGAGRVIDDPAEAGGWPDPGSGPAPSDADGDGMPDGWESGRGSDPLAFDAWGDTDGNGWPDLEDYLNERAGDPAR
jgi:hypothetical protein